MMRLQHRSFPFSYPFSIQGLIRHFGLGLFILLIAACSGGQNQTPEQLIQSAATSLEAGKLNEAIIKLKKALQQEGNLPEARFMLGQIYLEMGNGQLAEREFNSASSFGFEHADMQANKLSALLLQGMADEVLTKVEKLISEDGDDANPRYHVIRGDSLLAQGKFEEAKKSYETGLDRDPQMPRAYVGLSQVAVQNQDYEAARNILNTATEKGIVDSSILLAQGIISFLQKDIESTERYFSETLELAPFNRQAMVGVIRARLTLNMVDEAKEVLNKLSQLVPDSPIVKYFRAFIAFQAEDNAKAKPLLLEILKSYPEHPEALLLLSNILYQENELEQVIEYMERFNVNFPHHVPATKLLAVSYLRQGSPEEAIKVLEKLQQRVEGDAQVYSLLGTAYLRSGNTERGSDLLEKAAQMNPDAADIRTQLALSHIASGSTDMAITELKTAVDLNPNLMSADIMLIMAHINQKDFDSAISAAENLRDKDPQNPLAYNLLGNAYVGKEDYSTAKSLFEKAVEVKGDFTPAMFNLARLFMQDEKFDDAEKQFRRVLDVSKNNSSALIGIAQIMGKRNDNVAMKEYLEQARLSDERSLQARVLLTRLYQAIGDRKNLMKVAKEAKDLAPRNPEVAYQYARALRLNGKSQESLDELTAIAKQYPDSLTVKLEVAKSLLDNGNTATALKEFEEILEKEQDNEQAILAMINIHLRNSELDKAKEYLSRYEKIQPQSAEGLISKADIAIAEKDLANAITFYTQAYDLTPSRLVLYRLVTNFKEKSDLEIAQNYVDKWMNEYPNDNEIRLLQAGLHQQLQKTSDAIGSYESLVSQDSDNVIALNNLAWLYFQQGKSGKAVEYAEKAYKLAPNAAEIMDTLAWILLKTNKTERALGLLSQAVDKAPQSPAIRYHYAAALHQSGDDDTARDELEKALASDTSFDERPDAKALFEKL